MCLGKKASEPNIYYLDEMSRNYDLFFYERQCWAKVQRMVPSLSYCGLSPVASPWSLWSSFSFNSIPPWKHSFSIPRTFIETATTHRHQVPSNLLTRHYKRSFSSDAASSLSSFSFIDWRHRKAYILWYSLALSCPVLWIDEVTFALSQGSDAIIILPKVTFY